jgi:hypothetical protein
LVESLHGDPPNLATAFSALCRMSGTRALIAVMRLEALRAAGDGAVIDTAAERSDNGVSPPVID